MGPIREEDEAKKTLCPYKFGLMIHAQERTCDGSLCSAWQAIKTTKDLATGIDGGPGWTKGDTTGVGGAVTQRTTWVNYSKGGCARI